MKHPTSRAFFDYWNARRGSASAPDRSELKPDPVRDILGDIFVLSYDPAAGYPVRVAGTRVCALLNGDIKDQSFSGLFGAESRREIEDIVGIVAEETLPTVAGVTAQAGDGALAHLELLLLPFHPRAHTPLSLTGSLAMLDDMRAPVKNLTLTSWRHIHQPAAVGPRALRRWSAARGLMVYEGLR